MALNFRYLYTVLIFFFVVQVYQGQIDNKQNKSVPLIKGEESKKADSSIFDTKLSITKPISTGKVNGMTVPESKIISPQKKEFSMFGEEFANPGELYVNQVEKHQKSFIQNEQKSYGSTTDQYFGDFKTKSKNVQLVYRDFGAVDGDRVKVMVNDELIVHDVTLTGEYRGFKLDLITGFNKIDFVALNQGEQGPNTAQFYVLDENGNYLTGNSWNLATGVKATIILVKEEE